MGHFGGFFEEAETFLIPIVLSVAKGNFWVKRSRPPRKIPRNAPLYVLTQTKKYSPGLSKSEVHWYFYVLERERGRGGERERESKSESEKGKGKKRERTRVRAIIFLNCAGQNKKSANIEKSGIVCN
jgi:hypothetical protein